MPEVWRKTESNFKIIVWQSVESLDVLLEQSNLSEADFHTYSSFQSETRKREWVTVRAALRYLSPEQEESIVYDQNHRPHLMGSHSISISHSGEFVAVMLSDSCIVGIDIEKVHSRIETLSRKFVNEDEARFINAHDRTNQLHVIWGAKEVLFKIYSKGGVDFRKHLHVAPFEISSNGNCTALIKKNDYEYSFDVYYRLMNDYMITWSMRRKFQSIT